MEKIPPHQSESKEAPKREVYFSVSNLVRKCRVVVPNGEEHAYDIAIRGKDTKEGTRKFQAIGGGAKLTDEAIAQLRAEYPEIRFRDGEESDDARFYLPVPEAAVGDSAEAHKAENTFVHSVLDRFSNPDSPLFKSGMEAELTEELTKEGDTPILDPDDLKDITVSYEGTVSPKQWEKTTSGRAGNAGYFRFFHLYDLIVPEAVFEKVRRSNQIRVFSPEDIAAMARATAEGKAAAELPDGSVAVENLFPGAD